MRTIILAGGLGTRLRSVIGESMPKCMAPVKGKPFIAHLIDDLQKQGIYDITLSLGYKAEVVMQYFKDTVKYSIEDKPLGTGGAIKNCLLDHKPILVMNGDTFAPINYVNFMYKRSRPLSIAATEDNTSAGIYSINPTIFNNIEEDAFSFEAEVIPETISEYYYIPWFLDIGTPAGYEKAQEIL